MRYGRHQLRYRQGPVDRDRLLHRRGTAVLARVAERGAWLDDRRFAKLETRLQHQDALDPAVEAWTPTQERYDCMMKLQKAGVPAGVYQNADDRVDTDPQLRTSNG
jgi:crotonobetainyl-CoA:carnitine CoA-transferase CaiB-like acyl-CoA transferase